MKKFLALSLAALMTAAIATSCGGDEGGDTSGAAGGEEKPEIVWISTGAGDWDDKVAPIIDKYNETGSAKVVWEGYQHEDLFNVIEVKIASGSTDYDIIGVDVPMVASYASREMILPLDEYFTEEDKAKWTDADVQAGSYDGKFYCPPMNTSAQLLWYNTALLEEAGVTVRENDASNRLTWDEVTEMARQTLDVVNPDGTAGIFGLEFEQVSRVYQMNAIPNSMGGKNIGDDGFTVEGVINDDAWIEACTWYQDQVKAGICSQGIIADEVGDYFQAGKIVFLIGGTWTASNCENAGMTTYGYTYAPTFVGHEDEVATPTGSWTFGVNAASEHPDEAADFIRYITLDEGSDMWLEANGDMPSRVDKLDEIINDPDAPGHLKIAAEEAKTTAYPRALTPGFNEYQTILGNAWEDIRNGSDVKTSLDNAAAQLTESMAQYQE